MQRVLASFLILAVLVGLAWAFTPVPGEPLAPTEAMTAIGQPEVRVRMMVRQSKDRLQKRGIIYLDSEQDFQDPKNLGIAVSAKVAEEFKRQGIDNVAAHFKGHTIEITGCVMQFEERLYMPVLSADQLRIVDSN